MSSGAAPQNAVMAGGGVYNSSAALQASGIAAVLPLLENAAHRVALGSDNDLLVIADYGSSEGRNSLAPMRAAIATLRIRAGLERPIAVYHVDKPTNDFNTLFRTLASEAGSYASGEPNVFSYAVRRSFYDPVLPPGLVHVGWSSYSAMWLSRVPALIPGHFHVSGSTGAARAEFDRQAALDWENFLRLRARELRAGGRLVIVLSAPDDQGSSPITELMDYANLVVADMVAEGAITPDERAAMLIPTCQRRRRDVLAPFAAAGHFEGLIVEHCDLQRVADEPWAAFQRDGDAAQLAIVRARFFYATFVPTLATALVRRDDAGAARAFADRLEDGLRQRLAANPAPMDHFLVAMVLAKTATA